GAPWVLDPAVLGDGRADLREPERRRRSGVELTTLGAVGRRGLLLLSLWGGAPLILFNGGGEAGERGDTDRPVAVGDRGRGGAPPPAARPPRPPRGRRAGGAGCRSICLRLRVRAVASRSARRDEARGVVDSDRD